MNRESTPAPSLRAWIDVDLGALLRNARAVSEQAQRPLIPMVKADGYGVGAMPVVRTLESIDPFAYGVATLEEGIALRAEGIGRRIILFSPTAVGELERIAAAGIIPALSRAEQISAWRALGGGEWHLAIDTGMHRSGAAWDQLDALAESLRLSSPAGVFTHFHSAELDDGSLARQEQRFHEALSRLALREGSVVIHTDNSASIMRRTPSPWGAVRPGVFLYGVDSGARAAMQPEPVAHMRARIISLCDVQPGETVSYGATWRAEGTRRIATVAAGYADGYRRSLSNVGRAILHDREVPVAGVVTMDMTMLDVTGVPCELGDVATLLGRDGSKTLTAGQVAQLANLSPYELLTGLNQRLPRVYGGGIK